ncbi:MAG: hypothetical protein Ct9H90mP10_05730 [Actinomycetota bacterium]|nr:MAG: hypothetical protein Ct9H90mP10_05730 [Actinomycetota bacterium]
MDKDKGWQGVELFLEILKRSSWMNPFKLRCKIESTNEAELGSFNQFQTTTLYVTHDQVEAMTMGEGLQY